MEAGAGGREHSTMLKRGIISLTVAAVPGLLSYTRIFETMVPAANIAFCILFGFSVLSFLFALFEDETVPAVVASHLESRALSLDAAEVARVAS